MKPGRELDCLVVEKVLSIPRNDTRCGYGKIYWEDGHLGSLTRPVWRWNGSGFRQDFQPSTDIAAAWELVNRLISKGEIFRISKWGTDWEAEFAPYSGIGESAPHAICVAALKAVNAL